MEILFEQDDWSIRTNEPSDNKNTWYWDSGKTAVVYHNCTKGYPGSFWIWTNTSNLDVPCPDCHGHAPPDIETLFRLRMMGC